MMSPDDCCVQLEGKNQLLHMYRECEEEPQAEHHVKHSSDVLGVAEVESINEESAQSTFSAQGKERKLKKFRKFPEPHFNHGMKRTVSFLFKSGFRRKEIRTVSRQNLLDYIYKLENTVKKQHNNIRYLQMKLRKHKCIQTSQCKHTGDEISSIMTNNSWMTRITESEKETVHHANCVTLQADSVDLLNQRTGKRNNENSQCNVSKCFGAVHLRLGQHSEELSRESENPLEQCMSSEDMSFTVNKVQNIQSDCGVHLYTYEIKRKNNVIDECDEGVKKCIEEFILREDVSVTDLNVKSEGNDKVARFRRHFLIVLYKQFLAEVGSECSFLQFCKCIPKDVIKPSPTYWKNLMCPRCENTELKFMEIVSKVLMRKDLSLEEVLSKQDLFEHVSLELSKLKDSLAPFTYRSWARTLLGKMEASERIVTTTIGSACTDILKQLDLLKDHMIRCYNQYEAVKEAREETEMSPIHAMVHIDWYESPATFVARLLHTSYYCGNGFKSLHAGFVRTQEKSYGFASLSDCRDHTAPAVWASINDILVSLAKEGMKVITVVSDSATAQYRNKGNFYLMRRFAKQNNVEMKWIYLEGGHGKGIADAVGASVKQLMCDTIAKHPNKSFRNTVDILPFIKDLPNVKVFSHSEHLVQQYKNLLSRQHLQVIPSTYKIHEVCVKETSFYVKESSADKLPFFSLDLDTQSKGN
ncbi:uncharacterized protein LOC135220986 [Macrobrachium nipponense]|uniref:uncharacterized protein LOC135220986 n=1 Tax=Macrobrachium nipponense TaxID=159736 RepID=UPI0030C7F50C